MLFEKNQLIKKKNIIDKKDSIYFIPCRKNEFIQQLIDNIFIPMINKDKNEIRKNEEFYILNNSKSENYKKRMKYFPLIKKNNIFKIKRVKEFEILKKPEVDKSKKKTNVKKSLPIIKSKTLVHQLNNILFIPSISKQKKEIIEKEEENEEELLRILIPIQEFIIERKDSIELKPLIVS